jgi:hypothetical protein
MLARAMMTVGTLVLVGAPGSPAPSTTRYKIESKAETTIDLTAMGQGTQTQNVSQLAIITVALADSAGGKSMHVVIDSVASDIQLPGAAETLAKAKGGWLHGFVDARGHATILKTSADSNDFVAELKSTMSTFFPRLKVNAKTGESWIDTTRVETKTSSRNIKSTTITTYTAGGDDTMNGEKAVRIEASFASTAEGTVENPMAGSMNLESSDTGTGKYYLGPDGRFLGGSSRAEGKATVKSAMVPDPIPLKLVRTSSVTIIK